MGLKLTVVQRQMYYRTRLLDQRLGAGENRLCCPFHDDTRPSLRLNMDKGIWICYAGCGSGGCVDFEKRFSNCDTATAGKNIAEMLSL